MELVPNCLLLCSPHSIQFAQTVGIFWQILISLLICMFLRKGEEGREGGRWEEREGKGRERKEVGDRE